MLSNSTVTCVTVKLVQGSRYLASCVQSTCVACALQLLAGECCVLLASGSNPTEDSARQLGGRVCKIVLCCTHSDLVCK